MIITDGKCTQCHLRAGLSNLYELFIYNDKSNNHVNNEINIKIIFILLIY